MSNQPASLKDAAMQILRDLHAPDGTVEGYAAAFDFAARHRGALPCPYCFIDGKSNLNLTLAPSRDRGRLVAECQNFRCRAEIAFANSPN